MAIVWPDGKGPHGGKCHTLTCPGTMVQRVQSRYYNEWVCNACGGVESVGGRKIVDDRTKIKHLFDEVYKILAPYGQPLQLQPFLSTVDVMCFRRFDGHIPTIKTDEIKGWGYKVTLDFISRIGQHDRTDG